MTSLYLLGLTLCTEVYMMLREHLNVFNSYEIKRKPHLNLTYNVNIKGQIEEAHFVDTSSAVVFKILKVVFNIIGTEAPSFLIYSLSKNSCG